MSSSVNTQEIAPRLQGLERTGVIVPTCNAGRYWSRLHDALQLQGISPSQVLIVDSQSTDNTQKLARVAGYNVMEVRRKSFRHGATRQLASGFFTTQETLIFITQDALPCGDQSFENLLRPFEDPSVGAVYGRQVARKDAGPIERHARLFNYPASSELRELQDREHMGYRVTFFSNSFAAYRRAAFEEVGGFPTDTIVSEEFTVVARMLLAGWRIAYEAEACAAHSHDLTLSQEFSRYFDIGVHHGRSRWMLDQFGTAGGHGRAFVVSQVQYLWKHAPLLLASAAGRTLAKWISYQLGLHERWLPLALKTRLSGQQNFWLDEVRREQEAAELVRPRILS